MQFLKHKLFEIHEQSKQIKQKIYMFMQVHSFEMGKNI